MRARERSPPSMSLPLSGAYAPRSVPALPTMAQRLDCRRRPEGFAVGRQRWNDLLFAHWVVDCRAVQQTLPAGLFVDTFQGSAYIGIVPFFMERVRPTGFPPVPFVSWFMELNVRTYVHDASGTPGVWFYSLDCNQSLAVAVARRYFHLPYFRAAMAASRSGQSIRYRCCRRDCVSTASEFVWDRETEGREADPGTLEFFLLERYLLFASDSTGTLFTGRVHHTPYRFYRPRVGAVSPAPAAPLGFDLSTPPVSLLGALPVDVSIFRLKAKELP